MKLTRSIEIAAPADVVWAVWTDVTSWPAWTAGVSRVDVLAPHGSAPFAIGMRARIRQPKFPPAVWQVTALRPGREFTWVSARAGARVTGTHRVESVAGGGSRATMELQFAGPVGRFAWWISRSLTEHYLDLEAAGLKARSEALPPSVASAAL